MVAPALHHLKTVHRHRRRSWRFDSRRGRACSNRHCLSEKADHGSYDQHDFKCSSHRSILCLKSPIVKLNCYFSRLWHGSRRSQSSDDPTVRDRTLVALLDQARELPLQRQQVSDLLFDRLELRPRNLVDGAA